MGAVRQMWSEKAQNTEHDTPPVVLNISLFIRKHMRLFLKGYSSQLAEVSSGEVCWVARRCSWQGDLRPVHPHVPSEVYAQGVAT